MAKKHFDDMFKAVEKQFLDMKSGLEDLQEECMQKVIDPDFITNYNNTLQPIRDKYYILCEVNYLLNLPQKDKKSKNKKFTSIEMQDRIKNQIESCKDINKKLGDMRRDV